MKFIIFLQKVLKIINNLIVTFTSYYHTYTIFVISKVVLIKK